MFPARDGPGGQLARTMAGCDVGACWLPPGQGGSRARAAPCANVCGCTCKAMQTRDLRSRDGIRPIWGFDRASTGVAEIPLAGDVSAIDHRSRTVMERRIRAVTVISEHRALIFDARAPITIFKSIGRYLLPRGPVTSRDKDARLLAFLRSYALNLDSLRHDLRAAIPLDGGLQPLIEWHDRRVAKQTPGLADVGQ